MKGMNWIDYGFSIFYSFERSLSSSDENSMSSISSESEDEEEIEARKVEKFVTEEEKEMEGRMRLSFSVLLNLLLDAQSPVATEKAIAFQVLEKLKHYLAHRRVEIKNLSLEIVNDALLTFIEEKSAPESDEKRDEDASTRLDEKEFIVADEAKLLPIIHNLWAPFSYRYAIDCEANWIRFLRFIFRLLDSNSQTVLKALELLKTMSICAKDFLSKKIANNIWPVIKSKVLQYDLELQAEEEHISRREKDAKTRYFNESVWNEILFSCNHLT